MSVKPKGVTLQKLPDGSDNPKYVDLLEEDKPIAGQKFVCMSFISPESLIKQRDHYLFEEFIKSWDVNKSLNIFSQFLGFVSYKYGVNLEKMNQDFEQFKESEKETIIKTGITDDYKTFLDNNEDRLDEEFNLKHEFQTSIRGVKVRGVFQTQKEAEIRCKMLREVDPNHDVFVGPVGLWVPFHPEAYKTGNVVYMEDTLNQLMHEKKKNEEQAKSEFDKRVKEAKLKAMEENKKLAIESGNKLTQTLNEQGELVGVSQSQGVHFSINDNLNENSTISDIRNTLFNSENVVLDPSRSDRGLSKLTHPPKMTNDEE
ncbi:MAG: hypothetical protein FJX80_06475 [Bacteroidetes bacterium]|nr:hypothetical protein [Bacteroidota bacterium]